MPDQEDTNTIPIAFRINKTEAQKIEKVFIDGNLNQKAKYLCLKGLEVIEKFPYLSITKELNPEDADFPPCDFIKSLYWEDEFLGFHCILKNPPVNLPKLKVGKISFNVCTPAICWTCVEICKKTKLGFNPFAHITLEQIREHKQKYKPDQNAIRVKEKGKPGQASVNRDVAFKLFALNRPKADVKKTLKIAERTYWRLQKEWEALPQEQKDKILKEVTNYS